MNDLRTGEPSDEFLRELVGVARSEAPAPDDWSDVVARRGTVSPSSPSRPRWVLAVAAAVVVAIGLVGLAVASRGRGGDVVPADTVPASTTVAATIIDPLADLGEDDWVAPVALPDGYEPIVAQPGPFDSQSNASILIGGDDVGEITIQSVRSAGVPEPPQGGSEVVVDGIVWNEHAIRDDHGNTLGRSWQRVVGRRTVWLHTSSDDAPLAEIASALRPVADDELTVARLMDDPDLDVDVAYVGTAVLRAHGTNGVYCLSIVHETGAASSGCGARTEPAHPIVGSLGYGGLDGSYTAGVAEANVARIEFAVPGGAAQVEPVDESDSFEQRFWITDDPTLEIGEPGWAVVSYVDGSSAVIRAGLGGRWALLDPGVESSPIDGPVVRFSRPPITLGGESSDIVGVVAIDGECLVLERDDGRRYPVVWPFGTEWDEAQQAVILPNTSRVRAGDSIEAAGAYTNLTQLDGMTGPDGRTQIERCSGNLAEIAVVDNDPLAVDRVD